MTRAQSRTPTRLARGDRKLHEEAQGRSRLSDGLRNLADAANDLPLVIDEVYNGRRRQSALGYLSPQHGGPHLPANGQIGSLIPVQSRGSRHSALTYA
jgi:hypothetical protein